MSDPQLAWVGQANQRGRAERGKTMAGRKGRGQRHKGTGTEKTRPSIRSNANKGK
jgi:large subunit ribosomal protein L15e